MHLTGLFAVAVLGASVASAHMEMQFPPPFKSKFNPYSGNDKDYSMTAPLEASGADYPCKGYQSVLGTSEGQPTASFTQGATSNITITGGANHGGGSCQISLSYDGAKTFTVIQSIIGGCPASGTSPINFVIPNNAPAGDAVLSWSWHNQLGNREMYQNCASIVINTGSGAITDAIAFASRPQIFVANVGPAGNGCTVAEGKPVDYPNPGPAVLQQSTNTEAPIGNCGSAANPASQSLQVPESSSSIAKGPGPSLGAIPSPSGGVFVSGSPLPSYTGGVFVSAPSSATGGVYVSPSSAPPAYNPPSAASPAASSSKSAVPTYAAPPGTGVMAAGTACTPEGMWNCIGGTSFQRCASGQWSVVQSMAAGTKCSPVGQSQDFQVLTAGA